MAGVDWKVLSSLSPLPPTQPPPPRGKANGKFTFQWKRIMQAKQKHLSDSTSWSIELMAYSIHMWLVQKQRQAERKKERRGEREREYPFDCVHSTKGVLLERKVDSGSSIIIIASPVDPWEVEKGREREKERKGGREREREREWGCAQGWGSPLPSLLGSSFIRYDAANRKQYQLRQEKVITGAASTGIGKQFSPSLSPWPCDFSHEQWTMDTWTHTLTAAILDGPGTHWPFHPYLQDLLYCDNSCTLPLLPLFFTAIGFEYSFFL